MSKVNDEVNSILTQLNTIAYNINYGLPVNVSVCPLLKSDLLLKKNMCP